MDDAAGMAIAGTLGVGAIIFGGRILAQVWRNHLGRIHAIRSIPLPRHTTLISWKPKGQIEAVFLDAFDTEYRRHFDGVPRYENHSAQEIAELRVFLLGRAFQRSELRILYETEVGVPLLRKLEDRDAEVCAWAQERLKVHRPLFRKSYTIDDLILKPSRFRWFLWTCGIGASQVLFFERIFQSLPITVVVRRLGPAATKKEAATEPAKSLPPPAKERGPVHDIVRSVFHRVFDALRTGDEEKSRSAITEARSELASKLGDPLPAEADRVVRHLDRFEERLDTFDDAFANETKKEMGEWAAWLREALTEATGGADLASLAEEEVLDRFKRAARFRWVTAKNTPPPTGEDERAEKDAAPPADDESDVIDTTAEAGEDASAATKTPNANPADADDPAAKIGF